MEVICFKLEKPENPMKLSDPVDGELKGYITPKWDSMDSKLLSEDLNNQVKNNNLQAKIFYISFTDSRYRNKLILCPVIDDEVVLDEVEITSDEKIELFFSSMKVIYGHLETISRDQDALNYTGITTQLYCLVAFYEGTYQGHIYSWFSKCGKYCFCMGIRNRVDNFYLKYIGKEVKNVSHYILEGVRKFALSKGCSFLVVTNPQPVMGMILPKLNFNKKHIELDETGRGLNYNCLCSNNYQYSNINKQISKDEIKFTLIP